jgi:hypothetical protein
VPTAAIASSPALSTSTASDSVSRETYSLSDSEEMLARIRAMFLVAIPILLLFGATGGYFLAKRSLAPVASMRRALLRFSAATSTSGFPSRAVTSWYVSLGS